MRPERHKMPQRREQTTFEVSIPSQRRNMLVSVGFYEDRQTPGEVFVASVQSGSDYDTITRDAAILLSLLLQYRVPMEDVQRSVSRDSNGNSMSVIGILADRLVEHTVPTPRDKDMEKTND